MPKTRAPRPTRQTLSLPTTPMDQLEHFWEHSFCVFGRKGIGKSTFTRSVQQMLDGHFGKDKQKVLNFRFEYGRQNLPILQVPPKGKRLTWTTFKDYCEQFCEDDTFRVAVIDSIDKCYDECFEHVCSEWGIKQPNDAPKGSGPAVWDEIRCEFESTLRAVQECGRSLVFLSHEKTRTDTLVDGTEFERIDLTCRPAASAIIKQLAEFILYYGYAGVAETTEVKGKTKTRIHSDRVITIRNMDNRVECACGRDDVFLQPDGKPLFRFEVPNDPSQVAATVQAAYHNELHDYDRDLEAEARAAEAKSRRESKGTGPTRRKRV